VYPGIGDEEAHFLLSKRARENGEAGAPGAAFSEGPDVFVLLDAGSPLPAPVSRAKHVAAPDQPKPAPIHIEASVTIASDSSDARGEPPVTDGDDRDWSDFDPDAWEEGQDYPEHLYRAVQDRDRDYYLVPRTDMDEAVEPEPPEEFRELRQRERELENALDALIEKHGKNSMLWGQVWLVSLPV
jgi:hypothetical protein